MTRAARLRPLVAIAALLATSASAWAALPVGAPAPGFTAQASQGGKRFDFSLDQALKTGPVVLYFYPAAFTGGCTIEAHNFAEAADQFHALGATVIGVSSDKIETLDKFSTTECRAKFPIAADPQGKVIGAYDARLAIMPGHADRISYVITPDHRVDFVYKSLNPGQHVQMTLDAVKAWKAKP